MAILEILKYPDPRLNQKSQPLSEVDDEIRELAANMLETMYAAPGIGLAAPQVGVLKRVVVIDLGPREGEASEAIVLVNPEIVASEGEILYEEGCLSVPEFTAEVKRYNKVTTKALNLKGEEILIEGENLLAVAIQHEIDHLDGLLFVDRLGSMKRDIFKRKHKKSSKEKVDAI